MRINNSRSSEIFDLFSDTMQKFNEKRSKRIIKKADRITGAAEAGELIAKWLGTTGTDISSQVTKVLDDSKALKSMRLADSEGGAIVRGFLMENPPTGLNVTKNAEGKLFVTRDELVGFIQGGGRIGVDDLSKVITEADALKFFRGGKGADKRRAFDKALREAMMPERLPNGSIRLDPEGFPILRPAISEGEKTEILQRLALRGMANNGALEQRLIADAIGDLEPDQIAALTKRLDDAPAPTRARPKPGDGPETGGNPRPEDGAGGNPNTQDGAGGNPNTQDGAGGNPNAQDGAGGNPKPEDGAGGNPKPEDGAGGNPRPEDGAGGNPRPEDGAGGNPNTQDGAGGNPNTQDGAGGNPNTQDGAGGSPNTQDGPRPDGGGAQPANRLPDAEPPEVARVRDELAEKINEVSRAGLETSVAQGRQLDAMEDALKKLKDLPPNPHVMRQMDSLKETIRGLENAAEIADGTADVAKMGGKTKFLLWTTVAAGAAAALYNWPSVKSFFDNSPAMRNHDPEKVKQLFSTAYSTMSACASDTGTVLSSMNAVAFTDNQVQRAHKRMIRELSTYNSTLSSLKKASLNPSLSQEEIRANIAMLNRTMSAMGGLVSVYMDDTGEIKSFAKDKKIFDQMQNDIRKVLPCYQNSLDTVQDEIKRLKIDTSEGGSTSAGAAATSTSGSTDRPGGIPSNAADFMYDPTVMATNVVKVPLNENIRVGNKMIDFVNIPMPRGFATRGQLVIKGAPWIAAALNDSRGKSILREEYMNIKFDPKMSSLKPEDLFQFATNRAAFRILNAGIGEDSLDDILIDESFQDVVLPGSEDKDDSGLKEFFSLGLAEDIEDRAGVRTTQQAKQHAQELGFADDGVTASSRKNQLKKISELIMSNENHRSSINKEVSEDSIRKKSDDFAKSYYKDTNKGLSTEDSFMKSYYAGFSNMYDEGQNDKPKLDYKDSYSLHDETGDDLIHEAHPEAIVVSDAIGNGGLVENGSEQKRQSHGVAQSAPTGNYRANYAWLQEGLLKK